MKCPFCKGDVFVMRHTNDYDMDKATHYSISCRLCDVRMTKVGRKEIIKAWEKGEK